MSKRLPRKHTKPSLFEGTVLGRSIRAEGRTKREAEKRLRTAFARQGLPTILKNDFVGDGLGPAYEDRMTLRGPLASADLSTAEKRALQKHLPAHRRTIG